LLFRVLIEGSGILTAKGAVGFFATMTVDQPEQPGSEMFALRTIREEWRHGLSANLSSTKPQLKIVDCWRPTFRERLRKVPDTRSFYEAGERGLIAARAANLSRAPTSATIWTIAEPQSNAEAAE
jgi:hypothetical protein